jgi:hypothetical protein
MRRIYESAALRRDEEEAFAPGRRERDATPRAMRSVSGGWLSRLLLPDWLGHRTISVTIETPEDAYAQGRWIPIRVTMANTWPVPVTLRTKSPVYWTWSVDGNVEAVTAARRDPPAEPASFTFDRGERKRFDRRWYQSLRIAEAEWEPVTPGEYTIGARINVANSAAKGLAAETTVTIE